MTHVGQGAAGGSEGPTLMLWIVLAEAISLTRPPPAAPPPFSPNPMGYLTSSPAPGVDISCGLIGPPSHIPLPHLLLLGICTHMAHGICSSGLRHSHGSR